MAGLIPFNRKNNDLINSGFDDFRNMLDDFFADNWPIRRSLAQILLRLMCKIWGLNML